MSELFQPISVLFCSGFVLSAVLAIVPFWFIFDKAGFKPALSLLMVIPVVNLVMLYILAFHDWKPDSLQPIHPHA